MATLTKQIVCTWNKVKLAEFILLNKMWQELFCFAFVACCLSCQSSHMLRREMSPPAMLHVWKERMLVFWVNLNSARGLKLNWLLWPILIKCGLDNLEDWQRLRLKKKRWTQKTNAPGIESYFSWQKVDSFHPCDTFCPCMCCDTVDRSFRWSGHRPVISMISLQIKTHTSTSCHRAERFSSSLIRRKFETVVFSSQKDSPCMVVSAGNTQNTEHVM